MSGPLFVISEAGYQVNGLPGDSRRLGNYKVGGWYDHSKLTDFESGAKRRGSEGFYGLFDQVLVPFGTPGSHRGFGIFFRASSRAFHPANPRRCGRSPDFGRPVDARRGSADRHGGGVGRFHSTRNAIVGDPVGRYGN